MLTEDKLQQLTRIAASDNGNIVSAQDLSDWPEEEIRKFENEKILISQGYAETIRCNRCHKGCPVEPTIAQYPDGQQKGVILCTDEDEGGRIEFEMEELKYWEINRDKIKKPDTKSSEEDMITLAEAGIILEKATGSISRLADRGEIKDNRIKGKGRRVTKTSVLLYKHNIEGKQEKADFVDYRQDKKKIPKLH